MPSLCVLEYHQRCQSGGGCPQKNSSSSEREAVGNVWMGICCCKIITQGLHVGGLVSRQPLVSVGERCFVVIDETICSSFHPAVTSEQPGTSRAVTGWLRRREGVRDGDEGKEDSSAGTSLKTVSLSLYLIRLFYWQIPPAVLGIIILGQLSTLTQCCHSLPAREISEWNTNVLCAITWKVLHSWWLCPFWEWLTKLVATFLLASFTVCNFLYSCDQLEWEVQWKEWKSHPLSTIQDGCHPCLLPLNVKSQKYTVWKSLAKRNKSPKQGQTGTDKWALHDGNGDFDGQSPKCSWVASDRL